MRQRLTRPSADRVISVTELQKLSLRRLREMRLNEEPLVVRDAKRWQRLFVILDHDAYQRLIEEKPRPPILACGKLDIDFRQYGLFWDRTSMTNERFRDILSDSEDPDHPWAWARVLERLPSPVIVESLTLSDLSHLLDVVKLRPPLQEAWRRAIEFWTQEARRRFEGRRGDH